jgi:hypothetical protein
LSIALGELILKNTKKYVYLGLTENSPNRPFLEIKKNSKTTKFYAKIMFYT